MFGKSRGVVAGVALAATGLLGAAPAPACTAASACHLPVFGPGDQYHPTFERSTTSQRVDNPYFPLRTDQTLVYVGVKDGKKAIDVVAPSERTRVVDGVRTRVVEDRLYLAGALVERTSDYYAQDRCGNVWYFGEATAELDARGHVISTEGSFLAGVDGAEPGVFMPARPKVGQHFRQEWSKGQAEDEFTVVDRSVTVSTPAGSFHNALRTSERTRLEPGVLDEKVYAHGVGQIVERSLRGPVERLVLREVIS